MKNESWRRAAVLTLALISTAVGASPSDIDPSFGTQGVTTTAADGTLMLPTSVVVDSSDRVYVLVSSSVPENQLLGGLPIAGPVAGNSFRILRFSKDGTLDSSFANAGSLSVGNNLMAPIGLALDETHQQILLTGGYYPAGMSSSFNGQALYFAAVERLGMDGTPDPNFGNGGTAMIPAGNFSEGDAIDLLPDGHILVAGDQLVSFVARFNSDGSIDTAFGSGGIVTFANGNSRPKTVARIVHDAQGSLYLCGPTQPGSTDASDTAPGVVVGRFTAEGAPVASFDPSGAKEIALGNADICLDIQPHGDGSFALATFQPTASNIGQGMLTVAEVGASGSLDPNFNGTGLQTGTLAPGFYMSPHAAAQSSGKLVLAGSGGGIYFIPAGETSPNGTVLTRVAGTAELAPESASSSSVSSDSGHSSSGGFAPAILVMLAAFFGLRRAVARREDAA